MLCLLKQSFTLWNVAFLFGIKEILLKAAAAINIGKLAEEIKSVCSLRGIHAAGFKAKV